MAAPLLYTTEPGPLAPVFECHGGGSKLSFGTALPNHRCGELHPDQVKLIAQRVGVTERDVVEMNRRLQKAPLSRRELHVKSAFQPRKRHSECWQPIRKARWASFLGSE